MLLPVSFPTLFWEITWALPGSYFLRLDFDIRTPFLVTLYMHGNSSSCGGLGVLVHPRLRAYLPAWNT